MIREDRSVESEETVRRLANRQRPWCGMVGSRGKLQVALFGEGDRGPLFGEERDGDECRAEARNAVHVFEEKGALRPVSVGDE